MQSVMRLVLLVSATLAAALPPRAADDDKVIDLQELLLNVSDSYRDFGHGIGRVISDMNANFKLALESADASARRLSDSADANAQRLEQRLTQSKHNDDVIAERAGKSAEAGLKRLEERLERNTDVLDKILQALGQIATALNETRLQEQSSTTTPTTTTKTSPTTGAPPATSTQAPDQSQNCAWLYKKGERSNGNYVIEVAGIRESFQVYCDMTTDGGGWTVLQRRGDFGNAEDFFYRTWAEYKAGFGDWEKEFWLGNDRVSALSRQKANVLRVDLRDFEGNRVYAKYSIFRVDHELSKYKLTVGDYSGNAGDSLSYHNGMSFSTKDRDNDQWAELHCAQYYSGAWWFNHCHEAHLNGLNLGLKGNRADMGVVWRHWKGRAYSLAFSEMKMRPLDF